MTALASGDPWPSSGGMLHCTKLALEMLHCNDYCALHNRRKLDRWQTNTQTAINATADAATQAIEAAGDTAKETAADRR